MTKPPQISAETIAGFCLSSQVVLKIKQGKHRPILSSSLVYTCLGLINYHLFFLVHHVTNETNSKSIVEICLKKKIQVFESPKLVKISSKLILAI